RQQRHLVAIRTTDEPRHTRLRCPAETIITATFSHSLHSIRTFGGSGSNARKGSGVRARLNLRRADFDEKLASDLDRALNGRTRRSDARAILIDQAGMNC
ncbi:hypothetical protein, partial [Methylorubrum aminovorans]|uniref:hypothetical protein n=1 Tax=Methylorubrum aminovorans TaxID=269069 RepID=UPI001EDE5641